MKGRVSKTALVLLVLLGAFIGLTRRDFGRRNLRLFSGMVDSFAYRSQTANSVFTDGKTQQAPVPGTIARGEKPFPYPNTPGGRQAAGWNLENPYADSPQARKRGREVYRHFCLHCHGPEGRGYGPVARRSLLAMSIVDEVTRRRPDGGLFHILTYGRLYMPAHGGLIDPEDRWKVIAFVRELQRMEEERVARQASDE